MSAIVRGNLRMALSGVRGNKGRSVLTMLGVIVGIAAVVTVAGIGEGVKNQVSNTLGHFGKELIVVRPGHAAKGSPISANNTDILFGMNGGQSLSLQDVQVVQKAADVQLSAPLGVVPGMIQIGDKTASPTMLATNANAAALLDQPIAYGGFWSASDENSNFAVLGRHVAERLFDEPVPLGRSFSFRGQTFIVRGIFAPFAAVPFSPTASFDDAIFIPYQTAAQITNNNAGLYALLARPDAPGHQREAIAAITAGLQNSHGGVQDFSVLASGQSMRQGDDVIHLLTLWIWAVAAISLLIGGVGIMNIMLLTVTERMHEIGVRKAIGASSRQIWGQFMLEATVLSLGGGVVGIGLSLGVIGLLRAYTDLRPVISWQAMVVAAVVSLAIGIVFGTIPAVKAARKDPIDALRHE